MLAVKDVAARLNVSTSTVYELVESGELPHYRIKSAIRVSGGTVAGISGWAETGKAAGEGGEEDGENCEEELPAHQSELTACFKWSVAWLMCP